jgi:hypothetical protein
VHAPTKDKTDDIKDGFYVGLQDVVNQFAMRHMKMLDFNAKVG